MGVWVLVLGVMLGVVLGVVLLGGVLLDAYEEGVPLGVQETVG